MEIDEQFNLIAKEYDSGRRQFIPCFDDYYIRTTDFISSNIKSPKKVLDLGAGTGLLTMFWYQIFPKAEYLLVDIAEDMLKIAKKRFAGMDNISYQNCNYADEYPFNEFDTVISALSIHHLDDTQKQALFKNIFDNLPQNGMFVNYDQFCAGTEELNKWFDTYWENSLINSDLSVNDIERWKERKKLDKECSVEEQILMLKSAGFSEVKCVYSYQKFSVIVAIK